MLLSTAVMVGALMVFSIRKWLRRQDRGMIPIQSNPPSIPAHPIFLFERPQRWLAVKCSDPLEVQAALGVHNATPCSWVDGFSRMAERKLFISPPVRGWVFVIGPGLPDPCEDADECFHFVLKLSEVLESVQMFSVTKILQYHAWIRAENYSIYRAYVWAGQTLWNQGEMTLAEKELSLKCQPYGAETPHFLYSTQDWQFTNCERVWQLASRWSIDPMAVDWQSQPSSYGISGEISQAR